jgi:hypothetical protein
MHDEAFARLRLESVQCALPGYGVMSLPVEGRWECCVWDDFSQPPVVLASFRSVADADDWCRRWNDA